MSYAYARPRYQVSVYITIGPLVYKILLELDCGVDEYLCVPCARTKTSM